MELNQNSSNLTHNFDDLTTSDFAGMSVQAASKTCFNQCIRSFTSNSLSSEEKSCVLDCHAKLYFAHANTFGSLMQKEGGSLLK